MTPLHFGWGENQVDPIARGDTSESFGAKDDDVKEERNRGRFFFLSWGLFK